MLDLLRTVTQAIFTGLYAVVMLLTVVFVLPIVLIREWLVEHTSARKTVGLVLLTSVSALVLSGCSVSFDSASQKVQSTVQNSVSRSKQVVDRTLEFARGAPAAPYEASDNKKELESAAREHELQLTGTQLAHIAGAVMITKSDPATVAMIIEQELRWLDEGELERDVLSALTGENSSVGIGQVRVSTAEELEQEDPFDVFPEPQEGDEAHTERVRRLANDDWNILYASNYIYLLELRYPYDGPLDIAQRYLGASPEQPQLGEQAELYEVFRQIYE